MSKENIRFVFTGGGSGGHVSPALAVAAELKKTVPDAEITYIGVKNKAEGLMVPKAGFPLKFVKSAPMPTGKSPVSLIKFGMTMVCGLLKASLLLLKIRPAVIFATGGYVSAPTVFAAWILRKVTFGAFKTKIIIHESNVDLGKMNRMAARAADEVAVSFSETIKNLPKNKGFFSGYPVRGSISVMERSAARKELGIPENAFVIFAFGGSQGARTINRVLANASSELLKDPDTCIIHGAGKPFGTKFEYHGFKDVSGILDKKNLGESRKRYILCDFIDNMGLYYAASDLLVIRAGAGSIMEVCRQGKASVIIPISNLSNDHQVGNARFIEHSGAAAVIYEKTDPLNGIDIAFADESEFIETVSALRSDPTRIREMAEKAKVIFPGHPASIIVSHILYRCGKGEKPKDAPGTAFLNDRVLGLSSTGLEKFLKTVSSGAAEPLEADELKLVKNKIDMLFSSKNPILRARACRSAGACGYSEVLPLIVKYAGDRNSAPFLSRDACSALKQLVGKSDEALRGKIFEAIVSGCGSSYYETRFSAEMCIPVFASRFEMKKEEKETALSLLYRNMKDRCFEVRSEAVLAASKIETDPKRAVSAFSQLYFDAVWKVRVALLQAFEQLVMRKIIDPDSASEEIEKILITSNGYTTEYELKKEFQSAMNLISKEKQQ